jgi:hypothetical protein
MRIACIPSVRERKNNLLEERKNAKFFYEYPIPLDTRMVLLYSMSEAAT